MALGLAGDVSKSYRRKKTGCMFWSHITARISHDSVMPRGGKFSELVHVQKKRSRYNKIHKKKTQTGQALSNLFLCLRILSYHARFSPWRMFFVKVAVLWARR